MPAAASSDLPAGADIFVLPSAADGSSNPASTADTPDALVSRAKEGAAAAAAGCGGMPGGGKSAQPEPGPEADARAAEYEPAALCASPGRAPIADLAAPGLRAMLRVTFDRLTAELLVMCKLQASWCFLVYINSLTCNI